MRTSLRQPDCVPIPGFILVPPLRSNLQTLVILTWHMPEVQNPHLFIALQLLIPFIGTLFFTSLIEFLTLFDFQFEFNFSLRVTI